MKRLLKFTLFYAKNRLSNNIGAANCQRPVRVVKRGCHLQGRRLRQFYPARLRIIFLLRVTLFVSTLNSFVFFLPNFRRGLWTERLAVATPTTTIPIM